MSFTSKLTLVFALALSCISASGQSGNSGGIKTTNSPFTGAVLLTDGTRYYWGTPTNLQASATNAQPPSTVLTNLSNTGAITNIGNGLKLYDTSLSKLDPAVTFPAYHRAVDLQRPITVFGMGDSVGHLTGLYVYQFLGDYYGFSGFANYAGNDFSVGTSATLVTALSYNTNWYGLHHIGTNGGYMTWSNAYNTFGAGGIVQADKLNIYYVANTNGGGFNIEVRTNGGAFAVVQSVQSKSYSPTGMVATVDLINGYYQAKVSFTNFQTDIIGASLFQTNVPGVRWGMTYGPGAPYYFLTNVPAAVAGPILRSIAPTMLLIESAGDSTIDASNSVANWMSFVGNTLTNTDIVLLGTPPTDPVSAYKWSENNQELKNVAAVYPQLIYFGQSTVSGSYSNIQHLGLAGDGLHRSNRLDMMFASELLRLAGANNGYHGTAMELLNRSNSFSGLTRFEDRVTLSPGKEVRFEDAVYGADVRLNISMNNAQALFNVFQVGVSDTTFMTYDMAYSDVWFANGVSLGSAHRPVKIFGTNVVEVGNSTNANLVVTSNVTAQAFIVSGTGVPIIKLQTMMSADNAFAISVRTNFTQLYTNFFEFGSGMLAGDGVRLHSVSSGQATFTNYSTTIRTNMIGMSFDYGLIYAATNTTAGTNFAINFSPNNTNHIDFFTTNWWCQWTNISGLAQGSLANKTIRITPSAPGQNLTNIWPVGRQHGIYQWTTNANSPIWTVLTNAKTYVLSLTAYGTNIHASMSLLEP